MAGADPAAEGSPTTWTYGMRLCLSHDSAPVVISAVGPGAAVGDGFRFLGASVRVFTPSPDHLGLISFPGWPPPPSLVPDALSDPAGFKVTTPCSDDYAVPYTELLIGLGIASAAGGGWHGIEVSYTADGQPYVLLIDHDLYICGSSVAAQCAGQTPSTSP